MTRRERLMATLRGQAVDRPAVNFYEISGLENVSDSDPYNIYSDPSWRPLIDMAAEFTDRIVMRGVEFKNEPPDPVAPLTHTEVRDEGRSRFWTTRVQAGGRVLTSRSRRDADINTVWTTEHLLKDADDLRAWLDLPERPFGGEPDASPVVELEKKLGDSGIVMIDTADPLCMVAPLFEMGEYTVVAMTETELFHKALQKCARWLHPRVEAIARVLPGRLWRIFGPEYASPPYLPPSLFHEYVVEYVKPMVRSIQSHGGFARIHSHGKLRDILDEIVSTGCSGLDPIEPPPQGDVSLAYVRERYGKDMVLFGNLEVSDLENLQPADFRKKVETAVKEGTSGKGRGFVLMPSACPYGRKLSERALANYRVMLEVAGAVK